MDKTYNKPRGRFTRRLVQLYAAVLYNCYARGFIKGDIYKGDMKLVCAPGLNCYSCPGAVFSCPLGALQNAVAASKNRAPSYILGILMLYGLLLGRTVCGWLCPVGLVQEACHSIPTPKLGKSRVTHALSFFKYAVLIVLALLIPYYYSLRSLPLPAFCKYICPAGTFEGAIGLVGHPANRNLIGMLGALFTNKFIILVVFLCASVFVFRAFCRFICPLGAIYSLFARFAVIGVKVEQSACINCGKCLSACKMDISRVGDRECINCGDCIDVCPTRAISFKAGTITLAASEVAPRPESAGRRRRVKVVIGAVMAALLAFTAIYAHLKDTSSILSTAVSGQAGEQAAAPEGSPDKDAYVPPEDIVQSGEKPSGPAYIVDESIPLGSEVGMRARNFSLPLIGGDEFRLSANLGKPVVINFWATWCTPCVLELPFFDRIYAEYGDSVAVIAVHSYLVTEDIEKYLSEFDYAMPFALDKDNSVLQAYGDSSVLPITVVIDPNGVITYREPGSITYDKLKELIGEALGGGPTAAQ